MQLHTTHVSLGWCTLITDVVPPQIVVGSLQSRFRHQMTTVVVGALTFGEPCVQEAVLVDGA
jgi:hypothetical protein